MNTHCYVIFTLTTIEADEIVCAFTCLSIVTVADADFPKEGRQPKSGHNLFGITFTENCMKMKIMD